MANFLQQSRISLCGLLLLISLSSLAQSERIDLGLDTLSLDKILEIQRDQFNSTVKLDSVHVELYLNERRIAIVPVKLMEYISPDLVASTSYATEIVGDKKVLLKILKNLKSQKKSD